ncbi:MAG: hypothetical protein QW548_02660 [Candidatus Aenigmatarchaeota archaeon]
MLEQPKQADAVRFHRAPAVPRALSEINPETDVRVRLLCRVIDKTVDGVIVEDVPTLPASSIPAPQIEVMLEHDVAAALKPDDIVRIFARVLPLENGFELHGELVQDVSGLDLELYKKIFPKSA